MILAIYTDPRLISRASELRRDMSAAEKRLWFHLRRHELGYRFRRQEPIGSYVADFACLRERFVIEVDGDSHGDDAAEIHDLQRTAELQRLGYRVIRFWNSEVVENTEGVVEAIVEALKNP